MTQHIPHSRHRAELRERAFELHCQLQSNRAIAVALGVPERTVRAWIKDILDETTRGLKKRRVEFLREAVAGQRAIAAAAWNAFNFTLDHERARLSAEREPDSPSHRGRKGSGDEDAPAAAVDNLLLGEKADALGSPFPHRERESRGLGSDTPTTIYRSARLLHVAFAAQREIAHLLRLYDDDVVPQQPVEILITRNPPWPEPDPSDYIPGSPDDPNYHPDDETNDDDDPDDNGLPADLKPTGNDPWRERYGYPPRSQDDSSLPLSPPVPEGRRLDSPSPDGARRRPLSGFPLSSRDTLARGPVGPRSAAWTREARARAQRGSGGEIQRSGGQRVRSETTKIENPATPATAISPASPPTPPSPKAPGEDAATLAPAPPSGGPEVVQPERPVPSPGSSHPERPSRVPIATPRRVPIAFSGTTQAAGSLRSLSGFPLSSWGTTALALWVPPLLVGHDGARTARSEKQRLALRSRRQSAAGARG